MSEIERNWVEVHDLYFGNAGYPSSARYRVADDGSVQRQIEIAIKLKETLLNQENQAYEIEGSNVEDGLLEGVHDIRPVLHIVGGAVTSLWIQGWIELGESGQENLEREKQSAMGGGQVIPWTEYMVDGESRRVL